MNLSMKDQTDLDELRILMAKFDTAVESVKRARERQAKAFHRFQMKAISVSSAARKTFYIGVMPKEGDDTT